MQKFKFQPGQHLEADQPVDGALCPPVRLQRGPRVSRPEANALPGARRGLCRVCHSFLIRNWKL